MRHVIKLLFPGRPEAPHALQVPLHRARASGTKLRTQVWKLSEGEARFRMVDADAYDAAVAAGERMPEAVLELLHRRVG